VAAWAFWLGGFAFYFSVVVPIGVRLWGGSEQGLVTQQATNWLNLSGVAALVVLLVQAAFPRKPFLLATWAILVALHLALFALHGRLDSLIDATQRTVVDTESFHTWHETYEAVAALQWLVGMIHLGGVVWMAGR
jgi:hypothetical protein